MPRPVGKRAHMHSSKLEEADKLLAVKSTVDQTCNISQKTANENDVEIDKDISRFLEDPVINVLEREVSVQKKKVELLERELECVQREIVHLRRSRQMTFQQAKNYQASVFPFENKRIERSIKRGNNAIKLLIFLVIVTIIILCKIWINFCYC